VINRQPGASSWPSPKRGRSYNKHFDFLFSYNLFYIGAFIDYFQIRT
jgi:hypothetical protein